MAVVSASQHGFGLLLLDTGTTQRKGEFVTAAEGKNLLLSIITDEPAYYVFSDLDYLCFSFVSQPLIGYYIISFVRGGYYKIFIFCTHSRAWRHQDVTYVTIVTRVYDLFSQTF